MYENNATEVSMQRRIDIPNDPTILDEVCRGRDGHLESIKLKHYDHKCSTAFELDECWDLYDNYKAKNGFQLVIS